MNNKEFINALKLRRRFSLSLSAPFNEGYRGGINFAIDLATKIDEPEKEVIPQDVADFIEDGNRYDKIAFLVHQKYLGVNSLMRECPVKDWLRSVDYKTVLSLVNGYEVEKEKSWVIRKPNVDSKYKHYLARFIKNNFEKPVFRHAGEEDPIIFNDKEKAAVIADWMKCTVELWED